LAAGELDYDVKWAKMLKANDDFKVPFRGIMMNNHLI